MSYIVSSQCHFKCKQNIFEKGKQEHFRGDRSPGLKLTPTENNKDVGVDDMKFIRMVEWQLFIFCTNLFTKKYRQVRIRVGGFF